MKFLAAASVLFLGALAVPTTQCGECDKNQHEHSGDNYPVGNHGGSYPGGNSGYPGHPTPGYPGGNNPGGNNPGGPGGNNPGGPGGNNPGGPGGNSPGSAYGACTSQLYSNAQCCSVDVLGLLGLDCANRKNFISEHLSGQE